MPEIERQETPRTIKARMVIEHPTPQEVKQAMDHLIESGVPSQAVISFNPWNTPPDRYYVVATWSEA